MGNGPSALHQAVLSGELDAVRKAIQDQPGVVDASEPSNGWSALHIAAAKGYEVIARELLARGAAPNLIDKEGRTPLHLAAGQGHTGVMRDLLRKGADPLRHDAAGKTPLDAALEQQQAAAVSLLSDALAGRGIPSNPTPTGSPTKGQGAANQQQQQRYYQAAGTGQVIAPDIAALDLGSGYGAAAGGGGGSNPAYPAVPAPYVADDSWLSRLPPPPPGSAGGGWGGPVSVASAPSAPPVSNVAYLQQQQQPQQPQQQQLRQQQQQQQQAAVDYYDFIQPTAPQAAPAAPPLAAGHAYPPVPSAAPGASIDSYADGGPQQQHQQQPQEQQPKQQPWWQRLAPQRPPQQEQCQSQQAAPVTQQPVPPPAQQQQQQQAAADDDDDGWGGAGRNEDNDDDGWGSGGVSSSQAAGVSAAAAAAAGAGGGRTPAASRSQPPNLNAAVGAAVSGAGKVAGAVGSIAVAGAKQLLKGVMQQPGAQGDDDDDDDYEQDESATWAGTPGRVYSYAELAAATKGFSAGNKLGAGGYGPVFRGVLDGLPVAVKLLDPAAAGAGGQQGPKEFAAEVAILSRLHHPHIVLLIGSCPERCGLVYELMEGGSLEQHLFSPRMPQLCWQDRVRIASEVASALCFLHSAPEPIVHMDLKPGNLLLNRSLVCKVGDVGLSRLMPGASSRGARTAGGSGGPMSTIMDSRLVGTPCYMDPEYLRTGRFGPKSDVYSLGVILLQMLTGLEASRVVAVVEAALARSQGDAASFASITDPRAGAWPITEAACLAHLAMRCVELQRGNRPDLRGELLPALMQLAERSRLFGGGSGGGGASAQRSSSLSAGSSGGPPSMMICPITQDLMLDPVFAADGYTYEREAIAGWVATHSTSPMTNLPLANKTLTPNLTLRSAIKEWEERQAGGGR